MSEDLSSQTVFILFCFFQTANRFPVQSWGYPAHLLPWVQTKGLTSILTALHSTRIWSEADTMAPFPPSTPGKHHAPRPFSPDLMHMQREKQEGWKSNPRRLAALSLNHALYKPIQTAKIPAHPSKSIRLSHLLLKPKSSL